MAGLELDYGVSSNRVLPSYYKAYGNGSSARAYSRASSLTFTNTASYLMEFGDHHVTALVGHEYTNYEDDGFSASRSEEHTSELQSRQYLVCRLLLEKKKK